MTFAGALGEGWGNIIKNKIFFQNRNPPCKGSKEITYFMVE
jgi:hypothetical protein